MKPSTYLALGDSYTIGEGVPLHQNFPYQTVQALRKRGKPFHAPEIIAVTGWTTDELLAGIANTLLQAPYDFVTLLIGVNNQYRGHNEAQYTQEFEVLLKKAIQFAGNRPHQVTVLSIPDYGVTPFAASGEGVKSPTNISAQIDNYNSINKSVSLRYGAMYVDITPFTREALSNPALLAADQLHPSGLDYTRWALSLAEAILSQIK